MIAARTLKSKEAIEELAESGEDMEDIEIAASNAELALNSIGLTARTQTGDMKDLQVVLGEVAEKWGGLTKATKQYVSEQLAGNNRRSYFIGLMENYERVEELQKIAENSSGALMEASDKKAKSLEGRLNTLQNSWARLYEAMINSGTAKASVTVLAKAVDLLATGMEKWYVILPAVTASIIAFKSAMYGVSLGEFVGHIIDLGKNHLTTLYAKLLSVTGATNGLALAMTALKTVGVGVFVGGLVWAVGEYVKKVREAKITTDDLTGAIGNLNNNYSSLMGALDTNYKGVIDYNEIVKANKELQTLTEGTEEYGEKQDFINQKLEELSHMYPEISEVLTTQLLPLERKLELLDQEIAKQQELAKLQAHDAFVDDKVDMNGLYNTVVGGAMDASNAERNTKRVSGGLFFNLEEEAKKYDEALEQIETAYTNALARMEMAKEYHELGIISDEEFASEEEYFNKLITLIESKEYASQIIKDTTEDVKDSVEETVEITKSLLPSLENVFKEGYSANSWTDALEDLNEAMEDSVYTASEAEEAMGVLTKTFPEMRGHVNTLDEAIEYLANQSMLELSQQAGELNQILAEMNSDDFTGLDDSTLQNLLSMYPELGNHIQDNAYLQEFLNEKVKEYQTAVEDAAATGEEAWKNYYNNVLAYDSEFWNTKLKNTDEWATYEQGMQVAMRDFGAEILGIESQDFADYIDSKGGFREVDYSNCTNAAEAEALLQSSLLNDMLTWHGQYVNDKGGDRQTDMQNVAEFLSKQEITEATTVNDLKRMWSEYYNAKAKTIQAELKDLSGKIGKLAGDYGDLGNVDAATMKQFHNLQKQMRDLENSNNAMNNYFNSVNTALGGVSSSLTQYNTTANKIGNSIKGGNGYKPTSSGGSGNRGSGGSGNKGSGGSGGSGNKVTENVVEDLDLQIDKYQSLEEAINRVDEALARNAHQQEMVTNKADLKKLLEEEIQLMNDKKKALENLQKAQQKELNSVISDLKKSGFEFNGNELVRDGVTGGTVADRLLDAQNWANSATGSEKEWRKKDTLYLQEKINLYYELVGKVNDTNNEIDEMTLAIRKAKKEQEELLKAVENLADRYLQVTMKINRLDNELSLNKRKQELATGKDLVKLKERELEILAEKKLLNQQNIDELKEEKDEIAKVLKDAGFKFSEDGTIANYDDKWREKTDKYNTLAGYEAEDYKEYLDDLTDKIERYLAILNNELPDAEENYYDIVEAEKEAMKQQEEYLKQLQELIDTYDRLFDITQKLTKANNELSLIEEKMQHASYEEKLKYLERQEEIYKSQLALLQQQAEVNKQIVNEKQYDLINLGFEFDEDGYIKNYDDIVGGKLKEIEAMEGGTIRDEAIEDYNDLVNKVEEYNNAMQNVVDSEKQWWEVNNAIKDAQQEQLDIVKEIQDSIGNAITNRWEETTSKLKEELDKQKEMLNRQWSAEDWEDELADAQDELNKLQAQINNLSKDTSQAGQLKLQQLKEQYAEQLKAMNDMIKDHEREMTNQAFQDEADALDKQMEEALKVEELMKSVNEALATGFVTIGEEAIRLNDLLVDQLKEAKELWGDLTSLGLAITHKTPSASELSRSGGNTILPNNSAPLVSIEVMGNLDGTITRSDLDAVAKEACDLVIVKLNDIMK